VTTLSAWEAEGYAPGTLNHRLRSLKPLFDELNGDGEQAINPCAKIRKRTEPQLEERGTSYDITEGVLACIPDVGYAARPSPDHEEGRRRDSGW
jgi:hypothetical protein